MPLATPLTTEAPGTWPTAAVMVSTGCASSFAGPDEAADSDEEVEAVVLMVSPIAGTRRHAVRQKAAHWCSSLPPLIFSGLSLTTYVKHRDSRHASAPDRGKQQCRSTPRTTPC